MQKFKVFFMGVFARCGRAFARGDGRTLRGAYSGPVVDLSRLVVPKTASAVTPARTQAPR